MAEFDNESVLNDLAFLADVTGHLDQVNTKLHGANQIVSHVYDRVRIFARKLVMFCSQLERFDFLHFYVDLKSSFDRTLRFDHH